MYKRSGEKKSTITMGKSKVKKAVPFTLGGQGTGKHGKGLSRRVRGVVYAEIAVTRVGLFFRGKRS